MTHVTTRRALFAPLRGGDNQMRPPWSLPEAQFVDLCTRCGACASACRPGIVVRGHGGFPTVDFTLGGCTLCGACATVCAAGCFDREAGRPWQLVATISQACVETKGVVCRMCEEACEVGAIRFSPRRGGGSVAKIDSAACTGCGACVRSCPVGAIGIAAPGGGSDGV